MTDIKIFQTKRIRLSFAWYDLWIGAFVDTKNHKLYICPLPTILFAINLTSYVARKSNTQKTEKGLVP